MKFNKKYDIAPGFESLFTFKSKAEELEHEAKMLMFRFFSEFEKLNADKLIKKKDLAKAIGTSASYVTQMYQGDKLANLITFAKLQEEYGFVFEIKAKPIAENYNEEVEHTYNTPPLSQSRLTDGKGYWVYVNKNPDYNRVDVDSVEAKPVLKIA